MQKPRLTQRTAEALQYARYGLGEVYFRGHWHPSNPDEDGKLKRAIEYLEDLLRWKRAKENGK